MQPDVYICFIDYTNALDRVRHDEIINIIYLNIDGQYLRVVRYLYWEQTASVRIENDINKCQDIKRDVRQCPHSGLCIFLYAARPGVLPQS